MNGDRGPSGTGEPAKAGDVPDHLGPIRHPCAEAALLAPEIIVAHKGCVGLVTFHDPYHWKFKGLGFEPLNQNDDNIRPKILYCFLQ